MLPCRRIGTNLGYEDLVRAEGAARAALELIHGSYPHSTVVKKILEQAKEEKNCLGPISSDIIALDVVKEEDSWRCSQAGVVQELACTSPLRCRRCDKFLGRAGNARLHVRSFHYQEVSLISFPIIVSTASSSSGAPLPRCRVQQALPG